VKEDRAFHGDPEEDEEEKEEEEEEEERRKIRENSAGTT
jgi:hypothetical protein